MFGTLETRVHLASAAELNSASDIYTAGFHARCEALRSRDQRVIDAHGVFGVLASETDLIARLLITDDRAYDRLVVAMDDAAAMTVTIFAQATRCDALLANNADWRAEQLTAMVRPELETVPQFSLPSNLALCRVRRHDHHRAGDVSLEAAVAVATRASMLRADESQALSGFLATARAALQLLAARDQVGVVRGTSGFEVVGEEATVSFVNTDPSWQRRGVGLAMTCAALKAARHAGARRARLDASPAGAGIYRRLGFASAAEISRYRNHSPA